VEQVYQAEVVVLVVDQEIHLVVAVQVVKVIMVEVVFQEPNVLLVVAVQVLLDRIVTSVHLEVAVQAQRQVLPVVQ
jgi:hypothetical protein